MDWSQRLNAALSYFEARLTDEVSFEAAAELANCSLFHFMRMFEVVFGSSPAEYVRRRRLSCAALELAASNVKVVDVALKYGYDSPESFTKAFKKLFAVSPSQARTLGTKLSTWPAFKLSVVLGGTQEISYRIEERPAIVAVGPSIATTSENGTNFRVIPQFWDEANRVGWAEKLFRQGGALGLLGICTEFDLKRETFTYAIAVEKTDRFDASTVEGCREFVLPAARYAVFECTGKMPHTIQNLWMRVYNEWFPGSTYEHAGTVDFESYPYVDGPQGDADDDRFYSEIWIPIRERKSASRN